MSEPLTCRIINEDEDCQIVSNFAVPSDIVACNLSVGDRYTNITLIS